MDVGDGGGQQTPSRPAGVGGGAARQSSDAQVGGDMGTMPGAISPGLSFDVLMGGAMQTMPVPEPVPVGSMGGMAFPEVPVDLTGALQAPAVAPAGGGATGNGGQFHLPMPEDGDLAAFLGGDSFSLGMGDPLGFGGAGAGAGGHIPVGGNAFGAGAGAALGGAGAAGADGGATRKPSQIPFELEERVVVKNTKRCPEAYMGQAGVVKEVLLGGWYRVHISARNEVARLNHRWLSRQATGDKKAARPRQPRPPPRPKKGSLPMPGNLNPERASEFEAVSAIRRELTTLEAQIPWGGVSEVWRSRRLGWRKSSKNTRTCADLLQLMEGLVSVLLIPPDAGKGAWMVALQECRMAPDARGLLEPFAWLKYETDNWLKRLAAQALKASTAASHSASNGSTSHARTAARSSASVAAQGPAVPPPPQLAPARDMHRKPVPEDALLSEQENAVADARALLAAARSIGKLGSSAEGLLASSLDSIRRYGPSQLHITCRAVASRAEDVHKRLTQIAEELGERPPEGPVMELRRTDDDTDMSDMEEDV